MARRRAREDPSSSVVVAPPELVECVVEDWIDPWTEQPRSYEVDRVRDLSFWLLRAWGLQRRARNVWLLEHEIPRELACQVAPHSRPRFRDPVAFAAAIRARYGEPRRGAA